MNEFDRGSSKEARNCVYHVVITQIDNETGEECVVDDDLFRNVCVLAEDANEESKMCEMVINQNVATLAALIASSHKFSLASRIANAMADEQNHRGSMMENLLMDMFASSEGGVQ